MVCARFGSGHPGYGETFEKACEDLEDLVLMQITFAIQKDQPDMICVLLTPFISSVSRNKEGDSSTTLQNQSKMINTMLAVYPFPLLRLYLR